MKLYTVLLLVTLFLFSCDTPNSRSFSTHIWVKDSVALLYRDQMIQSLVDTLISSSIECDRMDELLGKPKGNYTRNENEYFTYPLKERFDNGQKSSYSYLQIICLDNVKSKLEIIDWEENHGFRIVFEYDIK